MDLIPHATEPRLEQVRAQVKEHFTKWYEVLNQSPAELRGGAGETSE